ncbi:MAG: ATP synthase F0 subunit C [Deltaproteobacteria bacterium]|nr:ATP synthase F0 subunit C [Deltaproteobacteria bacterium]
MTRRISSLVAFVTAFLAPMIAMAAPAAGGPGPHDGTFAVAMGVGMGLAALGCGMGQGRAAAAALEGICRNPNAAEKVNTPMLLGLAFIESLTIFTLVTAFLIYGKMGG